MKRRELIAVGAASTGLMLSACGGAPDASVDHILIEKSRRRMTLFENRKVVKQYRIHLGFAPLGHKQFEGDGKTPEGRYYIKSKNPNSAFHLSLEISYPNRADIAYARARGRSPGGDIFIHGGPRRRENLAKRDWTAGCIAVSDKQIEEVYRLIRVNTIIDIKA